jgi:NADPH2:quinone reductase
MTAVVQHAYGDAIGSLTVESRPVPSAGANVVIVRVAASPINPSDLAFLRGLYGFHRALRAGVSAANAVARAAGGGGATRWTFS